METYNCHKGNGWNYGLQIDRKKARVFRYHTNGNNNSNYEYQAFRPMEDFVKELGGKRISAIIENGESNGQLERLFHNGF